MFVDEMCRLALTVVTSWRLHLKPLLNHMPSGVPIVAQRKPVWLGTVRLRVPSLASLSGLRILRGRALWCRSQTRLGSRVALAVVQAGSCSSDATPSLGTSMCRRCGPEKKASEDTAVCLLEDGAPVTLGKCSHVCACPLWETVQQGHFGVWGRVSLERLHLTPGSCPRGLWGAGAVPRQAWAQVPPLCRVPRTLSGA